MTDRTDGGDRQRASLDYVDRNRKSSRDESGSLGGLLKLGLALGVGYIVVKQLPDLQRYLKMRQM